ncbi:hypothetical protein QJS10_CPA09g00018 [Acorus calamus]|uniref:Uncharacterized protein n=1 Tax=Acorus calamus TaxID=4465 RepID=A0AAV9E4Z2_ACOCL|nr:hypothetical protein QJS10_CPA09g00018 [Acorus calamus]
MGKVFKYRSAEVSNGAWNVCVSRLPIEVEDDLLNELPLEISKVSIGQGHEDRSSSSAHSSSHCYEEHLFEHCPIARQAWNLLKDALCSLCSVHPGPLGDWKIIETEGGPKPK